MHLQIYNSMQSQFWANQDTSIWLPLNKSCILTHGLNYILSLGYKHTLPKYAINNKGIVGVEICNKQVHFMSRNWNQDALVSIITTLWAGCWIRLQLAVCKGAFSPAANPGMEVRSRRSIYIVTLNHSARPDLQISIYHCFSHPHSIKISSETTNLQW